MKSKKSVISIMSVLVGLMFVFQSGVCASTIEIEIDVAPNVLNLQNQGEVVTVHTDIAYSLVAGASVSLNGVDIYYWKSDDRGNFVAKFHMEEIKALDDLLIGGMNTLTLIGETKEGDSFEGSQDIKVINIIPKGK